MRQSLSESGVASAAAALSGLLVAAGVVDQVGSQTLLEHAVSVYAPHGKHPGAGLLYGLVYTVAAVDLMLWLVAARVARRAPRTSPYVLTAVTLLSGSLAALLLGAGEYGARVFPTPWGVLALLPAVAGAIGSVAAIVGMRHRRAGIRTDDRRARSRRATAR
jgi:hypothetical protein